MRRNQYTGRPMVLENLALALLAGLGFWRKAHTLAERWSKSQ